MLGNSPMARQWAGAQLKRLIEIQGPRFISELDEQIAATTNGAQRKSLENLRGYLRENHDSMWYATRLKEGLPIGSGLIEGACKNAVAVRLKINNPRWRIRRAEKIAAWRCLDYSLQWDSFWQDRAA